MTKYQKQQMTQHFNPNIGHDLPEKPSDAEVCPDCGGYGERTCQCFAGELRWPVDETSTCRRCHGWGWIFSDGSQHDDELDDQERRTLIKWGAGYMKMSSAEYRATLTPPGMADCEGQQCLTIRKALDIILKPTPVRQRIASLNLERIND